ncbi:hypothetical protein GCM10023340_02950 [Nocardioides marinquilinus]|uniref:Uncharacterized protein n=1 Tax=Nocardioides marinquilinus TaxID=1210400 RepID=A0ABP9P690_9ACTN
MARCAGLVSVVVTTVGPTVVAPSTSAQAVAPPSSGGQRFACAGDRWGPPRPLPAAARQQRVAERVRGREGDGWTVRRVRPTHLGVLALVSGDVDAATSALPRVDHVISWTGGWLSDFPPSMRMGVAVSRFLDPVVNDVMRRTRGVPGRGGLAIWVDGTAVVMTWRAPVPRQVRRLAGVRPNGVEVRIVPRPYSQSDFHRAIDRLTDFLDERDEPWTEVGACHSERGLSLHVPGRPDRLGVTDAELLEAAGMPVKVRHGYYAVAD